MSSPLVFTFSEIEAGATSAGRLQLVFRSSELEAVLPGRDLTLRLTSDEARLIAGALEHWAGVADTGF